MSETEVTVSVGDGKGQYYQPTYDWLVVGTVPLGDPNFYKSLFSVVRKANEEHDLFPTMLYVKKRKANMRNLTKDEIDDGHKEFEVK